MHSQTFLNSDFPRNLKERVQEPDVQDFRGFAKGVVSKTFAFGGCSPAPKNWNEGTFGCSPVPKPEQGYMRMFPGTKNWSKGTFAKTALLRNRPFVYSRDLAWKSKTSCSQTSATRLHRCRPIGARNLVPSENRRNMLPEDNCKKDPCDFSTEMFVSKVGNPCPTLGQLLASRILYALFAGEKEHEIARASFCSQSCSIVGQLLANSSPTPHPMGSCRGLPCSSSLATQETTVEKCFDTKTVFDIFNGQHH